MTRPQSLPWIATILSAGQGTRMKSALPKVLHPIGGKPMLSYVVDATLNAEPERVVVVVGHGADRIQDYLGTHYDSRVTTALQPAQRGTGDAVRCALDTLKDWKGWILVLHGDVPLIRAEALQTLVDLTAQSNVALAMLTGFLGDPTGYGRILRDERGQIAGVREHRDCSERELQINEVNPAIYLIESDFLRYSINTLSTNNSQNELYLTDVVERAAQLQGITSLAWDMADLVGVNDRYELASAENGLMQRLLRQHCLNGVTVRDPSTTTVESEVTLGRDVHLEGHVTLRGKTSLEENVFVDVGCVLDNVTVKKGTRLLPYTVAADCVIGIENRIGPFSHLRAGTELGSQVHLGNFVETKKTRIGDRSKANHLAYLGDGIIGKDVNVGAGTIFCNYDGTQKHATTLDDGCFIGSDSQLVAPVRVGKAAYVASGTTVTRDVPEGALALSRPQMTIKEGYAEKKRKG